MHRDRLINLLGWAGFALACSVFVLPVVNPDVYWHLSAGRYTLAHLGPPRTDFLSWPLAGAEWVDFEWLPQVFYYLLHKAGGFRALQAFKAALLVLTLLAFRYALLLHGRRAALPLLLPFFALGIMSNCDLRPENFTLLFFTLLLCRLEKFRLGRLPGGLPAITAFIFFALWANLHAGYLYGLALAGLYAAGELLTEQLPFIYGRGKPARPAASLEYLKVFAAGLLASLANPYGWKIYAVILDHQRYIDTLQQHIQEWSTFSLANAYQWPYGLALALVFGAVAVFLLRRRHVVYHHFAALLFFAWASANHSRHIPFFIITGLVFAAALPWEGTGRGARRMLAAATVLLLAAMAWFYPALVWSQYSRQPQVYRWGSYGLAAFLRAGKAELSGLKLYNHWGWGGWLGWELWPDYRPFIDGRYLFHGRIEDVTGLRRDPRNWRRLIEKYGFDLALIKLDEPLVPLRQKLPGGREDILWRPPYLLYMPRSEWAVVYWDYAVAALVRRSAVSAAWLKENELRWLRPGDTHNLPGPLLHGDIPMSELRREFGLYRRTHLAGHDKSAVPDVEKLAAELEALCARKGARCAK